MTLLTRALVVFACFVPGIASAATVAAFSAEAGASLTLLSARIVGTAIDASEFLELEQVDDAGWLLAAPTGTGTRSEMVDVSDAGDPSAGLRLEATGRAEDPAGEAWGDAIHDRATGFLNLGDASVELTFGYALSAAATAEAFGPGERDASASANAFLGLGTSWGSLDLFTLTAAADAESVFGFEARSSQARSGVFSLTLGAGETLFSYLSVGYEGHARVAEAPAPVPLPASALLLAAGLGGFGAFRRRRATAG